MVSTLPHDPYINAVIDALTAAGLEPTDWWTSNSEIDPYRTDADAGVATMLSAYLAWDGQHPASTEAHEHGIALMWDHPAEEWQWAPREESGHLAQVPDFVAALGLYADPGAVAATVWALVVGNQAPEGREPDWGRADEVRAAVEAWATNQ